MKGQFDYLGIKSPDRKLLLRDFLIKNGIPSKENIHATIRALWALPEREYQYCGMDISVKVLKHVEADFLTTIEFMIENKSWWDTVDFVAASISGSFFKKYFRFIPEIPSNWSHSLNMWSNRSAILYQLKYKVDTDTDLLSQFICEHAGSKEFFIQKAIGWVLREYSKTNPDWVKSFISKNQLAPLSVREGLKWLNR